MLRYSQFLAIAFFLTQEAFASDLISWKSSGYLASILIESDFPSVKKEGIHLPEKIDFANSSCLAKIMLPNEGSSNTHSPQNFLACQVLNIDDSTGSVFLSLADFIIEFWKTSPRPGPIFQTRNDQFSEYLFKALEKAYNRKPRIAPIEEQVLLTSHHQKFVDYYLKVSSGLHSGTYLTCGKIYNVKTNAQTQTNEDLVQTKCVFLIPDELRQ